MPNVGGHFVEKFVATIYHYLQYAYYKCMFTVSRFLSPHNITLSESVLYLPSSVRLIFPSTSERGSQRRALCVQLLPVRA